MPMRKALFVMLFAGVSSCAEADWVYAARDSAATTYYVDPATVRRVGATVKMWHLIDYGEARMRDRGKPFFSTIVNVEYDCQAQRIRSLFVSSHTGNMERGDVVYLSSDPGEWGPVSPGSAEEFLWKIACGRQ